MPSFEKETIVFILVYTWIMISKSECDKCDIVWVNRHPNIFAYQKLHGGKRVWMNVQLYIYQNSYLNAFEYIDNQLDLQMNILNYDIFKWIFIWL